MNWEYERQYLKEYLKNQWELTRLEFRNQLLGKKLTAIQKHIKREREKMTRSLWLKIMWRDNWTCQIRYAGCTIRAQEVDHIKALFNWGYTEESNLQAACHYCNRKKGIT